jgi:hypothetical protein
LAASGIWFGIYILSNPECAARLGFVVQPLRGSWASHRFAPPSTTVHRGYRLVENNEGPRPDEEE